MRMAELESRELFGSFAAKIGVGLGEPVGARRIENVELDGVFEGPGFVRHIRRDAETIARGELDLAAVDAEFHAAFEAVGELLVDVVVHRHVGAFFQDDAGEHHVFADYQLAIEERIEMLKFDVFPAEML